MSETLKEQHKQQLDAFRTDYIQALTEQWSATKKELSNLQDAIVAPDTFVGETIQDSGIVTETIGTIPKYFLDEYLSEGLLGSIVSPFVLQQIFDQKQFDKIKDVRKDLLALRKQLGTDSFATGLQQLQAKNLGIVQSFDEKDFYQDSDEIDEHRSIDFSDKDQMLFADVQSEKFNWNKKSGVTRCSRTARLNADNFGIKIPRGNAFDAKDKAIEDGEHFVATIEKEKGLSSADFASVDTQSNFADIFVQSNGQYAQYGHRAVVFKNLDTGKRYVLDPYRSSVADKSNRATKKDPTNKKAHEPKLLDDYIKNNTIIKSHFYAAEKVVVDVYKPQDAPVA